MWCEFVNLKCEQMLFNHNISQGMHIDMMLVEIPDLDVILGGIIAFMAGMIGLYAIYKIRSFVNSKSLDVPQLERLEYYERQLIDMKMRLDSLDLVVENDPAPVEMVEHVTKRHAPQVARPNITPTKHVPVPSINHMSLTDYVLHLITDKAMTSRDIQTTLQKSREHTSRLLKKMFDDGYVQRNTDSKPYTYSLTLKGTEKIKKLVPNPMVV